MQRHCGEGGGLGDGNKSGGRMGRWQNAAA